MIDSRRAPHETVLTAPDNLLELKTRIGKFVLGQGVSVHDLLGELAVEAAAAEDLHEAYQFALLLLRGRRFEAKVMCIGEPLLVHILQYRERFLECHQEGDRKGPFSQARSQLSLSSDDQAPARDTILNFHGQTGLHLRAASPFHNALNECVKAVRLQPGVCSP